MQVKAKVKTNSKKFEIAEKDGILHISLTEPAEGNRANIELVKEMSKICGSCKILRGLKSRTKVLELGSTERVVKQAAVRLKRQDR